MPMGMDWLREMKRKRHQSVDFRKCTPPNAWAYATPWQWPPLPSPFTLYVLPSHLDVLDGLPYMTAARSSVREEHFDVTTITAISYYVFPCPSKR